MIDKVEKNKYSIDKDELRRYLIDNSDEVIAILEFFKFHDIKINNNDKHLRCALPNSNNPTSVAVDLNTLYCNIFVLPTYEGDLYGMLQHWNENFGNNYQWDFRKVIRIIDENILHISKTEKQRKITDCSKISDSPKMPKVAAEDESKKEKVEYELDYLNRFVRLPHIKFIRDGILPFVQEKYCICYDDKGKRIVIPHFKLDDKTKIIGLKARTTVENYELFGIPKYINSKGYDKSKNLYALSHNIDIIKKEKQIILFESEKSVMKLESYNIFPCIGVALGGNSLSDWQSNHIGQLAKEIEFFEVIIALDKDITEEHMRDMASKLRECGCNRVSYILDERDLLGEKDAPIDKGFFVWCKLYWQRKRIE